MERGLRGARAREAKDSRQNLRSCTSACQCLAVEASVPFFVRFDGPLLCANVEGRVLRSCLCVPSAGLTHAPPPTLSDHTHTHMADARRAVREKDRNHMGDRYVELFLLNEGGGVASRYK